MYTKVAKQSTRKVSNQLQQDGRTLNQYQDCMFLPKGSWVMDPNEHKKGADEKENVQLDLPPSYREQVDEHLIRGAKSDFEKFLEGQRVDELPKVEFATPDHLMTKEQQHFTSSLLTKNLKTMMRDKIQQLEKTEKLSKLRQHRNRVRELKKMRLESQKPKTIHNVDPVKEARRQATKARMQVARLREAARELRRQTVEQKVCVDPYAAVKARKVQDEQEDRKFFMQNPHTGLAHKVRVMSGYSKPNRNTKRRRR